MAYQTGTASSPVDRRQKLVAWLSGLGWHTDLSAVDGAGGVGWRAHLDLHGNFVHLRAFINEAPAANIPFPSGNVATAGNAGIALYLSTAFNGSNAWSAQPGNPPFVNGSTTLVLGCGMALPSGAIQNYFFFADATADNIVVVVEKTPGVYVYIGWGLSLQTLGTITGGAYFFGSSGGYNSTFVTTSNPSPGFLTSSGCPCSHADWMQGLSIQSAYMRVDVDSFTGKWLGVGDQSSNPGYTGKNAASPLFLQAALRAGIASFTTPPGFLSQQTSQIDGRANLLPILLWAARDATPGGYSPVGTVPNIFYCNGIGNGFSNAQEIALGPTTYK